MADMIPQVYAYLKRLGYSVIRAHRPSGIPNYPVAAPHPQAQNGTTTSAYAFLAAQISRLIRSIISPFRIACVSLTYDRPLISELYRVPRILIRGYPRRLKSSVLTIT